MTATDASDIVAWITPPDGVEKLRVFMILAVEALGWRSDADLARDMGVPAATLASWKRRGSVSEEGKRWFRERFLETLADHRFDLPSEDTEDGRMAVLELLDRTAGNPLGAKDARHATAHLLAPLFALASFLDTRMGIPGGAGQAGVLADLLQAALPQLKRGLRLPFRPEREGAQ